MSADPVPADGSGDTDTDVETDADVDADPATDSGETEASDPTHDQSGDEDTSEAVPDLSTDRGGFYCEAPVETFRAFFEQFTPIVEEIKLHLEQDGLSARAVDPANVGMVDEDLPESAFDHYSSTGGLIGLDLNRMMDILGIGDAGVQVSMELDQETRKLEIVIDGLEYRLALIDPDSIRQEPDIPDLELPATVELEGRDLERAVTAADMVSDHIRFQVDTTADGAEACIVSASGDTDDVDLELTREDLIDLEFAPADSLFSLDYLNDMVKPMPSDATVRMHLGEEFPVFLEFEHIEGDADDDGTEYHADVTQMLAPRISSED